MNDYKAQIITTEPTVIRPNPPVSGNKHSHAKHPGDQTSSAATFTATAPPGEQLLLDLPAPKPPPEVKKIRDAANSSYEENRPLLAVLNTPTPEEIRAIDLQALDRLSGPRAHLTPRLRPRNPSLRRPTLDPLAEGTA